MDLLTGSVVGSVSIGACDGFAILESVAGDVTAKVKRSVLQNIGKGTQNDKEHRYTYLS